MSHERHAASSPASTSAAAEENTLNCFDASCCSLTATSPYTVSPYITKVDLAHLLAARDQELRALSAEMNQVQSELRLARNLIAERGSEIQRIRVTNNQYVEENERLRAILSEWSARAAKSERVSNIELQKSISKLRSQAASNRPAEER